MGTKTVTKQDLSLRWKHNFSDSYNVFGLGCHMSLKARLRQLFLRFHILSCPAQIGELDFVASFGQLAGHWSVCVSCCLDEIQRSHLKACPKRIKTNPAVCLPLGNQVGLPEGGAVGI